MVYDCCPYESAQNGVFNGETGRDIVGQGNAFFPCFQNFMINRENLVIVLNIVFKRAPRYLR